MLKPATKQLLLSPINPTFDKKHSYILDLFFDEFIRRSKVKNLSGDIDKLFPWQKHVIKQWATSDKRVDITLTARQVGYSFLQSLYAVFCAISGDAKDSIFIGHKQDQARMIMRGIHQLCGNLEIPAHKTMDSVKFANGSQIIFINSSVAARGTTLKSPNIFLDQPDFNTTVKDFELLLTCLVPCCENYDYKIIMGGVAYPNKFLLPLVRELNIVPNVVQYYDNPSFTPGRFIDTLKLLSDPRVIHEFIVPNIWTGEESPW